MAEEPIVAAPAGAATHADGASCPETSPCPGNPAFKQGRRVHQKDLLNLLNFVNFSEGMVSVCFDAPQEGENLSLEALPQPCIDDRLYCKWLNPGAPPIGLGAADCRGIIISCGQSHVSAQPEVLSIDAEGIAFRLPDSGYERSLRSVYRHQCEAVEALMVQSGVAFKGRLVEFSAVSCRVEIESGPESSFRWLCASAPVTAMLFKGGSLLYSGECAIARMDGGRLRQAAVLIPRAESIRRYAPRKFRGERHILSPSPVARFRHPLTGRQVDLQVKDISGMGIGVEESVERSVLLPGLMIPGLTIEIANNPVISCAAQVVYRSVASPEGGHAAARSGIVFLDLDPRDEVRLSAFLHPSSDDRFRVCGSVDMEELWRFFFDSGFVYPSKYLSIEARKQEFKRTYEKLYSGSPTIARHFLYQDRGQIHGHISMIRCYSNTWILHHHAASNDGYATAGVKVLDEAGRFVNDFRLHPSAHLGYLICYYREENRFPSRVFGGSTKSIADSKGSSVDALAYLHLSAGPEDGAATQLFPARKEDLAEAVCRYERLSGGLMLDALDLTEDSRAEDDAELTAQYASQGFRRDRQVFSLKRQGKLQALIVLTLADLGLNLSNLTNCLHAIVTDGRGLDPASLFSAMRAVQRNYGADGLPALVFPAAYLDDHGIAYEKQYILWVLDTDRGDAYFESLQRIFGRAPHGR